MTSTELEAPTTPDTQLRTAIANCTELDDAAVLREQVQALRVQAVDQLAGAEPLRSAAELLLRADRLIGKLLPPPRSRVSYPAISKQHAYRCRTLAALPRALFEEGMRGQLANDETPSLAHFMRLARSEGVVRKRQLRPASRRQSPDLGEFLERLEAQLHAIGAEDDAATIARARASWQRVAGTLSRDRSPS